MSPVEALQPFDEHNQRLASHVAPADWQNPTPQGTYHLVVIGAGTAGLVTAAGAAGLGAKVALVERELMGGDCLNVGCVPSKGMISASRVMRTVRDAEPFGVQVPPGATVDFSAVMQRMRRLRADISPTDSARRFRKLGIDVYFGQATFTSSHTIEVAGTTLPFNKAAICTGARAAAPAIAGLDSVPYLTNETVFSLTQLPRRLGVLGAGPIGCELAQAFALFGSQVVLVEASGGLLPKEDRDAAQILRQALINDGVRIRPRGRDVQLGSGENGTIHIRLDAGEASYDEEVDQLLVAVGRAPNVEGLGLETIGIEFDARHGVRVDDRLQTTHPKVYAAGDICSPYKFTHAADFMARIVIQNALMPPLANRAKVSALTIPWSTYTSPEIAHVGLTPQEASDRNIEIDTYTQPFAEVDRAILENETAGFVRVHARRGTDQILGATIVAAHAGDLISEITLAMTHGLGLKSLAATIHPYPTQADAIRKIGDQYNRTRLTPTARLVLDKWLQWSN
jgi:pyruvate/2-oxoglutarate dehydrogenase complex dihydrolipoamide dehydrogenase (E3) component